MAVSPSHLRIVEGTDGLVHWLIDIEHISAGIVEDEYVTTWCVGDVRIVEGRVRGCYVDGPVNCLACIGTLELRR